MEKKVDIFLIFVLNGLQVQKAISYHLITSPQMIPNRPILKLARPLMISL